MLNKDFIQKIKEELLLQKRDLLMSLNSQDIDMDGDEIDEIQGKMLLLVNNQLNYRNAIKISQIQNALDRIEKSIYGFCQDCGDDIPEKRLLINPYFLTCISCAEERELTEGKHQKRG